MKNIHAMLPLACSAAILLGQMSPAHAQTSEQELRVEPILSVRHSEPGLETWYKLGRFHQEHKRYDLAAEAFRHVLDHDPGHVEARNALGTIYSLQNRFDEAIAEFETLLRSNPKLAHVYNNLGYTYFLKADFLNAVSAFGNAIAIDPRNSRAFGNLVRAYQELGLVGQAAVPAPAMPASVPTPVNAAKASTNLRPDTTVRTADTASPVETTHPVLSGIELEIANGTRDVGLGEFVANALREDGATVIRVTGLKPYTQRRNVVLYQPGFYEQALAVSRRFSNPPAVAPDTSYRPESEHANVRLILGRASLQAQDKTSASVSDAGH